MNFSSLERYLIYIKVLGQINGILYEQKNKEQAFKSGICGMLVKASPFPLNLKDDKDLEDIFPEVYKRKPFGLKYGEHWFTLDKEGLRLRKAVILGAINDIKKEGFSSYTKLQLYRKLLDAIILQINSITDENSFILRGYCYFIEESSELYVYNNHTFKTLLPELYKYKPVIERAFWFPTNKLGLEKRQKILEEVITNLKITIENENNK